MMEPNDLISKAQRVARSFNTTTSGERAARHSVYIVLLHDARFPERWGLYVGQTARDPDCRFDQHKSGYKASAAVTRFGVQLLPQLVEHLNPMREWESIELETALAQALV